ncbi:MAG: hypothetical protein J2P41_05450 [Blastocatellia bacterium]|nr:hypothetical protein [Blastocatellia bacterium]
MIVRSRSPAELVEAFAESDLENIVGVQLLSLLADVDPLADWGYAVPVELIMHDPVTEFALLYRYAKLLDKHPVRASIPAVPGLCKAVKVASALQFAVKLELGQPGPGALEEMLAVLDLYIHHTSISQPIEFFHSSFLSFYYRTPMTLWELQEDNPIYMRYVGEDGVERVARRLVSASMTGEMCAFVENLQAELMTGQAECCSCEFFENCGGYFKWPDRDYRCDGVKRIFRTLKDAADELRRDLMTYKNERGG